jgi:hypothetical protein
VALRHQCCWKIFSENPNIIAHQCAYRTVGPSFVDPDQHHFGNLDPHSHQNKNPDPDPHQHQSDYCSWIRNRIRINLQMTSQNVRNMSLYIIAL